MTIVSLAASARGRTTPAPPGAILHAMSTHEAPPHLSRVTITLLARATAALGSSNATARDYIQQALALLQSDKAGADGHGGLAPWQVRKVTQHIDAILSSAVRLPDCAAIVRLSPNHFSRAFKISMGVTFSGYVIRRRVERAQEMLLLTTEPLSQIALACGFADQQHFTRSFRREVNASPASWRRQWQPDSDVRQTSMI